MPCALSSKHIVQQNYKSIPEGLQLAMSLVSLGITKRPWPLIRGWVVLQRMLLWLSWLFWRAILTICFLYFRLVHSVNTIVGIWNNSMSPFFLSPLLFSCSRSVSVGVCSRYFQKALHIFLEAMRSWAVTEETRHQGMPREALFVPLNHFRRHGGFLSAQKEQCSSNAGWHRAVTASFFRVEFTTIPGLTNKFWTLGCLYFWRVVVEFVPLDGAWEEWLASARVGLLHYSTGFFFSSLGFPG